MKWFRYHKARFLVFLFIVEVSKLSFSQSNTIGISVGLEVHQIMNRALARCYSTVNGLKRISFAPATSEDISQIESLGEAAVPELAKYLDEEPKNDFTQLYAVKFLIAIGDHSALAPLKRAFREDQWEVTRATALSGMFQLAPGEAKAYVDAGIHDRSELVRQRAQQLLSLYQDSRGGRR